MSEKDLENIKIIYESMSGNVSPKNLFYGLKAMLDDGDDFELIDTQNAFIKDKLECRFIYKGTRYISVTVYLPSENPSYKGSLWVIIYEKDSMGNSLGSWTNEYEYQVPFEPSEHEIEIGILDGSEDGVVYNTVSSYDPVITSVVSFVEFVKAVLDETDSDNEPEYDPRPPNPTKKKNVLVRKT